MKSKTQMYITQIYLLARANQHTLITKTKKVQTILKVILDSKEIKLEIVFQMPDRRCSKVGMVVMLLKGLWCQEVVKIKVYRELLGACLLRITLEWINNCKISLILIGSLSNLNQNITMWVYQKNKGECSSSI